LADASVIGSVEKVPAAPSALDQSCIHQPPEMEGQAVRRQIQALADVSRGQTIHACGNEQAQHAKSRCMRQGFERASRLRYFHLTTIIELFCLCHKHGHNRRISNHRGAARVFGLHREMVFKMHWISVPPFSPGIAVKSDQPNGRSSGVK